jgi:hypothetical protein
MAIEVICEVCDGDSFTETDGGCTDPVEITQCFKCDDCKSEFEITYSPIRMDKVN